MELKKYGPWALVVGGSEGIGASYARKLAARGFNLVLTARKTAPLQALADDLTAAGTRVRVLSVDLSEADALERTRTATDDLDIGLLIYNAGANSVRGDFVDLDPAVYRSVIAVNVLGQAEFAHHYGALMCARGRGGIILSGSHASFMGAPTLAAYCGSKAFSRVFSEALWIECEKHGVDVLHLSVGFTATPAMARLGYPLDAAQSPDEAAQEALDNIANGPLWIAGGQPSLDTATRRSTVTGRADAIRAFATPGRF
ncbi:SDR family NAD(P)-dependent oxidoreductase [Pseudofrankia inefficax]|uniref:Short-chain dehydrogenase/reductase SDR n=1 Tax=Pseudofrankia inefficax (strain DSM 45817 / CECT 9037 / DDB 130130 / EuI1c) TaxID=298654 RepID=E3IUB0_PSEI1|nr:SDR family NAD(P)-dependent oxidoreductase [Pseudofrankia inefficax]ADP82447.1 short-chain dehydrogenase/reductase SDR [Pseudofrankia inefficax]